jgi:cytochrome c oxidase assembly protein Cox11
MNQCTNYQILYEEESSMNKRLVIVIVVVVVLVLAVLAVTSVPALYQMMLRAHGLR